MFVGEPRPHSQQGVSAQTLSCAEISVEMQDSLPTKDIKSTTIEYRNVWKGKIS